MFGRITVERHEDDKLSGQIWYFSFLDDGRLVLDQYIVEKRATLRHKFKPVNVWKRFSARDLGNMKIENEADVPLPEDVKTDAIKGVLEKIKVGKPSELGMS